MGVRTASVNARVKKGERIGYVGGEEPSLHFEIRQKNKARNPLFFLP
jgi:murein DD-endopeptidase MepM/ murein hydrolase activator NlpD